MPKQDQGRKLVSEVTKWVTTFQEAVKSYKPTLSDQTASCDATTLIIYVLTIVLYLARDTYGLGEIEYPDIYNFLKHFKPVQ